ncbi:hypothetical protein L7F22_005796 [Adiantum nelumboides]|nr:hypothetical protein [Adiantum nelumboides]
MEHKGLHHGDIVHLLSENKIVALGRVHTTEPSDLCHGELLGNGFCSISIDKCLDIQAYLPFSTIDASMVNEVVGGFVKWDIQNVKTVKEVEMNGHTYAATSPNDFIFEANGAPNTEDGEEDVGVVVDKSYNESAGTCTTDDLDCINLLVSCNKGSKKKVETAIASLQQCGKGGKYVEKAPMGIHGTPSNKGSNKGKENMFKLMKTMGLYLLRQASWSQPSTFLGERTVRDPWRSFFYHPPAHHQNPNSDDDIAYIQRLLDQLLEFSDNNIADSQLLGPTGMRALAAAYRTHGGGIDSHIRPDDINIDRQYRSAIRRRQHNIVPSIAAAEVRDLLEMVLQEWIDAKLNKEIDVEEPSLEKGIGELKNEGLPSNYFQFLDSNRVMSLSTAMQDQVNKIAYLACNTAGPLQRDAPSSRLSQDYPEPPPAPPAEGLPTSDPKAMAAAIVQAAKEVC